jgi:hypothetical protein
MTMSKARSGGGITSNKLVRPGVKNPTQTRSISPTGASELGSAMGSLKGHGNAATPLFDGKAVPQTNFGNEVARNVGKGGPGTGRTVYKTGTQQMHGAAAGTRPPASPDTLREFGPDYRPMGAKR